MSKRLPGLTGHIPGCHLDAFLALQSDAFWSVDAELAVVYFNEPLRLLWKEQTARRVERGDNALDFAPRGDRDAWVQAYRRALRGESVQMDWVVADGTDIRRLEVRLCPVVEFARPVGVAAHAYKAQDNDEQSPNNSRHHGAANAANTAKTAFLAHISHEIRTPLNAIVGMTELTLGTDLTQKQAEYLRIVKSNSHALLQLIGEILDFSKIEANQMALDSVRCDLSQLVAEVVDSVSVQAKQKDLPLHSCVGEGLRPVLTDPTRVRQILVNLLSNAIKYTTTGMVRVSLKDMSDGVGEIAKIRLTVEDTGIGIHPRDHRAVFTRFYRAMVTHSGRTSGTGLGLSITRSLVMLMGGRITLRSRPGKGSVFTVEIPMALAPSARCQGLEGSRVLVASPAPTELVKLLKNAGSKVTLCSNGHEVLDTLFQEDSFDSIVLHGALQRPTATSIANLIRDTSRFAALHVVCLFPGSEEESSGDGELFDNVIRTLPESEDLAIAVLPEPTLVDLERPDDQLQRPARILLVEDSVDSAAAARGVLEREGHQVVVAFNGEEAVQRYQTSTFDLVLMDVSMPEVDGLEATARIRAAEAVRKLPRTPIVAVTAHATEVVRRRCFRAGMDDFVTKPITGERINIAVRQHARLQPDILIADESVSDLAIIREHLESFGARVTEVRNGQAVVELCRDHRFHVVIIDLETPIINASEVTRRLRGLPGYTDTPIIALADAGSTALPAGINTRFEAQLDKPVDRKDLLAVLRRALAFEEVQTPCIEDLVPIFLAARVRDASALRELLDAADFEGVRRIGHQMKGCGTPYGFPQITELGAVLESGAKVQDAEVILDALTELDALLSKVAV